MAGLDTPGPETLRVPSSFPAGLCETRVLLDPEGAARLQVSCLLRCFVFFSSWIFGALFLQIQKMIQSLLPIWNWQGSFAVCIWACLQGQSSSPSSDPPFEMS